MKSSSPSKKKLTVTFLGYCTLFIAIYLGCEFLIRNPDVRPPEDLLSSISVEEIQKRIPVRKKAPSPSLFQGQSEQEVRQILGTPSGTFTVSNRLVLMYHGKTLNFEQGKLVNPEPNLLEQIKKAEKAERSRR